jgi:hypothetical protein
MEKTEPVKAAVNASQIVVACAYQGHVAESVKAALPGGFKEKQYVAKFVNGELVALRKGLPEEAIQALLTQAAQ